MTCGFKAGVLNFFYPTAPEGASYLVKHHFYVIFVFVLSCIIFVFVTFEFICHDVMNGLDRLGITVTIILFSFGNHTKIFSRTNPIAQPMDY